MEARPCRSRHRRSAACVALAIAVVLVSSLIDSSTATAVRTEFFGIAPHYLDHRDLRGMRNARVHTNRFEIGWRFAQPSQGGSFDWDRADQIVGELAAHGIRSAPFVQSSPSWVASSPTFPPTDTAAHEQAWQTFLKAAVARYKPGGVYWANRYRRDYGGAPPLPIVSWQIWNEPNVKRVFNPQGTNQGSVEKYARLLKISHNAIKSKDPGAQVVLAGNPSYSPNGGFQAWEFLERLYRIPGIKSYFDVAALHPYASTLDAFASQIEKVRGVIKAHHDAATPLWLTEMGWGSAPPDRIGINKGPGGQEKMLRAAFTRILNHRRAWNLQSLFWFLWRDPAPDSQFAHWCSFCGSGGLVEHDRTAKPALPTFKSFSAETNPPVARITSGPGQGASTTDRTPTFTFISNEPGSTFERRVDTNPFRACTSPFTTGKLSGGSHSFSVRAIDAPGNVSTVVKRSFRVDTTP